MPAGGLDSPLRRVYGAIAPPGAPLYRRGLGLATVALATVVTAPLVLAATLTPFVLLGLGAGPLFDVTRYSDRARYSVVGVATTTLGYAAAVVAAYVWRSRKKKRSRPAHARGPVGPGSIP